VKKSIALGLAGLALVASALAAQDPARRGGQGGKRKPPPQDGIVKPSMNDTVHGAVYADNWFAMYVNGTFVDPIDPLFLTPGYRWFDLDADRAKALDPMHVDIKDADSGEVLGRITVRMSYMPITFAAVDKSKKAAGKNQNPRFSILKNYNGFIVSRMGRVIDLVTRNDWTTFVNYWMFSIGWIIQTIRNNFFIRSQVFRFSTNFIGTRVAGWPITNTSTLR
jgi:hypothetical protein